jgi:predicted phosphoribosyltransferase
MFRNREEAALRLACKLQGRPLRNPIVLAIPRGGVVLGAVLARELAADLDVVLARKIRAPFNAELALGAVGEDGSVYLDPATCELLDGFEGYLEEEVRRQMEEIARRRKLLRGDRPPPNLAGRSVIVTDDGIATGSTMIAALKVLAGQDPHAVLVAVPVGSPDRLDELRQLCNGVVCLLAPPNFRAIGQYYANFRQVDDAEVAALLAAHAATATANR